MKKSLTDYEKYIKPSKDTYEALKAVWLANYESKGYCNHIITAQLEYIHLHVENLYKEIIQLRAENEKLKQELKK